MQFSKEHRDFYKNKKHIVCVTGDQGFQLNMQELQFISREKIPVLIFIINNKISGMIKDREKEKVMQFILHMIQGIVLLILS